jgi:membrane-bound lytic murein transglycosylase B
MGQPQFLPDVYLTMAVDWDGDGRRDIWTNTGDTLASIANYLATHGWRTGAPVFEEAQLPNTFDYTLADGSRRPIAAWSDLGVRRIDGAPWPASAFSEQAALFLPAGWQGPAVLVFDNFSVIKTYNNSDRYALAVALLARAFKGKGGLVRPWPTQLAALQRDETLELQGLLTRLGYPAGEADGMFGQNTRRAVRAFQHARGLPADGYPTAEVLTLARRDAGQPAPPRISTVAAKLASLDAARAAAKPLSPNAVRQLQKALARLGYAVGKPTGKVGPRTRAAIEAEERKLGLSPTGRANSFILTHARKRLADERDG